MCRKGHYYLLLPSKVTTVLEVWAELEAGCRGEELGIYCKHHIGSGTVRPDMNREHSGVKVSQKDLKNNIFRYIQQRLDEGSPTTTELLWCGFCKFSCLISWYIGSFCYFF